MASSSSVPPLHFDELAAHLDPSLDLSTSLSWKQAIDYQAKVILLYQLDVQSFVPKITKALRIWPIRQYGRELLTTAVFIADQQVPSKLLAHLVGKKHLESVDDLYVLLDRLQQQQQQHADIGAEPPRKKRGPYKRIREPSPSSSETENESDAETGKVVVADQTLEADDSAQHVESLSNDNVEQSLESGVDGMASKKETTAKFDWSKPGPDKTRLAPSLDVFIDEHALSSIIADCLHSKHKLLNELFLHMIGGDGALIQSRMKSQSQVKPLRLLGGPEVMEAICIRTEQLFNLSAPLERRVVLNSWKALVSGEYRRTRPLRLKEGPPAVSAAEHLNVNGPTKVRLARGFNVFVEKSELQSILATLNCPTKPYRLKHPEFRFLRLMFLHMVGGEEAIHNAKSDSKFVSPASLLGGWHAIEAVCIYIENKFELPQPLNRGTVYQKLQQIITSYRSHGKKRSAEFPADDHESWTAFAKNEPEETMSPPSTPPPPPDIKEEPEFSA